MTGPRRVASSGSIGAGQATQFHLGSFHSAARSCPDSQAPHYRNQSSKGDRLNVMPCTADASTTEEPDAGILHVRVCAGGRP